MNRPSKRSSTTPYTTASSYIPPEIRKAALNVLMQVRNDPALTLAVSSVNRNARSRAKFPKPKEMTSYYRHAETNKTGRYFNKLYRGTNNNEGRRMKASATYKNALKAFKRASLQNAKKDRFYLAKVPFHLSRLPRLKNEKVPPIYKELVNSIRKQNDFQKKHRYAHKQKNRYRYIGLVFDPAQPKRSKKK